MSDYICFLLTLLYGESVLKVALKIHNSKISEDCKKYYKEPKSKKELQKFLPEHCNYRIIDVDVKEIFEVSIIEKQENLELKRVCTLDKETHKLNEKTIKRYKEELNTLKETIRKVKFPHKLTPFEEPIHQHMKDYNEHVEHHNRAIAQCEEAFKPVRELGAEK